MKNQLAKITKNIETINLRNNFLNLRNNFLKQRNIFLNLRNNIPIQRLFLYLQRKTQIL